MLLLSDPRHLLHKFSLISLPKATWWPFYRGGAAGGVRKEVACNVFSGYQFTHGYTQI